jgi:hypothetical protein
MSDEEKMNEEKKKLMERGYESVKFRASDFLPNGKLVNGDEIINLHENDLHIEYMGELRQLIAVFDVAGVLAQCPLCDAPCDVESYIVMTNTHMLYPCWACDRLIERERNEEIPEAFA